MSHPHNLCKAILERLERCYTPKLLSLIRPVGSLLPGIQDTSELLVIDVLIICAQPLFASTRMQDTDLDLWATRQN